MNISNLYTPVKKYALLKDTIFFRNFLVLVLDLRSVGTVPLSFLLISKDKSIKLQIENHDLLHEYLVSL